MGIEILAMVMAGGKGERLYPLTEERSKPAVPFGGRYRLIDVVLSNLVNSGITAVYILTQYKAQSLIEHLQRGWSLSDFTGRSFVIPVPAQMRTGATWYRGTADAIYQNMNLIENNDPKLVAIFGADHVYRMDLRQMAEFHRRAGAVATVSAIPVPLREAPQFGIVEVDETWRIIGFQEKPQNPRPIPGRPEFALASMGNYLFSADFLKKVLVEDAAKPTSHDFGQSIFPSVFPTAPVYAYDFSQNEVPGRVKEAERGYWRDVGTIRAYYEANMDLRTPDPVFNLYNREWPLHTADYDEPPAKFVFNQEGRRGTALDSLISAGTIVSGGTVARSILGRNVFVHSYGEITESILMDGVDVGRNCRIQKAIIDKNVQIPPGTEIGFDRAKDEARFYVDPSSGIVVIPKASAV